MNYEPLVSVSDNVGLILLIMDIMDSFCALKPH